ncbi:cupin domain-containing protein [Emcibacter sp.]|uniref:cupin domain-containing protein n=1 Tax=Emcibacter sp. TaxID=1979954 RepID=UPI002AA872A6|nr:cupin domain-containing protein [Emcibacter sp.]
MSKFQRIDADAVSGEREPVSPDRLISGSPMQMTVNQYTNAKENMFVGIWASDAGKWNVSYTEDEFCTILEGEAILTEQGGEAIHLKAGDHFTVSAGFEGTWETVGSVRKLYVIYEE